MKKIKIFSFKHPRKSFEKLDELLEKFPIERQYENGVHNFYFAGEIECCVEEGGPILDNLEDVIRHTIRYASCMGVI